MTTANRAWVKRNLGFDPLELPAPTATFAVAAASAPRAEPDALQREIIDFDSEAPEGQAFLAFTTATGLSRFTDIPWPKALAPKTDAKARKGKAGALPRADALVVTWTVEEGHALSRVLTPGKDSRNDYASYRHNFARIAKKMRKGCPALQAGRLGVYWTTKIGDKTVVVFKSDSHLSQDTKKAPRPGETLPNEDVWQQIIEEVRPSIIITTGTAGGIGKQCEVGDVVVSPIVRFDCLKWLKKEPFAHEDFKSTAPNRKLFAKAKVLFKANEAQLPKDNPRRPKITTTRAVKASVLTTDFFGFDTSNNFYKLQGLGSVSEMGDAVLGLVRSRITVEAPQWLAVRNVSDPQIKAEGTLKDQAKVAAQIYKGFGRWSSVCSAIVCWALIAA
jgi:phosphorylase superfamily protein